MKVIILCNSAMHYRSVYSKTVLEEMKTVPDMDYARYSIEDIAANPARFADVEFIFSTWGMPALSEEEIRQYFPRLKCLFYAAGSVQAFARPFLNCGVKVFSAWAANGVSVAEYTVAQIILANKGFFTLTSLMSQKRLDEANKIKLSYPGNFKEKIGLIGCGMIGSLVAELLKQYDLEVLAFDPYMSDEKAARLNVRKCSLEELFSSCSVISNHLANKKATEKMLRYEHFASMRPYSTFINTGRGAQLIEEDLVRVLTERPDMVALLDVTHPEPAPLSHPFYTLPNCFMTPHIAGSILSGEQVRMAEFMLEEYNSYISGQPCKYEVTEKMLETMA